MGLRDVLDQT